MRSASRSTPRPGWGFGGKEEVTDFSPEAKRASAERAYARERRYFGGQGRLADYPPPQANMKPIFSQISTEPENLPVQDHFPLQPSGFGVPC